MQKSVFPESVTNTQRSSETPVFFDFNTRFQPPRVFTLSPAQTDSTGVAVTLSDATAAAPTFTAPEVTADTTLSFTVAVSDGVAESTASVNVVVHHANQAPTASVDRPAAVAAGATTILDGSASSDPDGDTLSYYWVQSSGPTAAELGNADTAKATFIAPYLSNGGTFTFMLVVSDGSLMSAPATITVTVAPGTAPASSGNTSKGCSAAAPSTGGWLLGLFVLGTLVRRRRHEL